MFVCSFAWGTVIFTGGTMGSVKIDRFEQNLTTLEVKKKAWATIRKMHARALLEAQDTVLRAYYDAVYASHTQARRNNSEAQVRGKRHSESPLKPIV